MMSTFVSFLSFGLCAVFALFPFLVYWEGCTKTVIYLYLFYPVLRTADIHGTFFLVYDEEEKLDRGVLLATWHDE